MILARDIGRETDAVLAAQGLSYKYGDFIALAPLELTIGAGELVALVGPNGAGKTTFLSMAAGLLDPSGGAVRICGSPAGSLAARAAVSYIPDTPVFYDDLSLNEHLEYVAGLHGISDWTGKARELLRRLRLEEWAEDTPSTFSRGMRQKASIALGLIRPFTLLLADEPFDGLDPASRSMLFEILEETRRSGSAVVVSTHRTEVIESARRCVALYEGEVHYDGPPDPDELVAILPEREAGER